MRRKFGLDAASYMALVEKSGGRCMICFQLATLAVDHNHLTGTVRGLLCLRCNVYLSKVEEDPEILARIANYLRGESQDG